MPILIHAGRGLPAIADDLRNLVERHTEAQLILAHAAIADLEHIARTLVDHPNVLYDTSVWSTTDLRTLLASASPEQIVFASDLPYGMPGDGPASRSSLVATPRGRDRGADRGRCSGAMPSGPRAASPRRR